MFLFVLSFFRCHKICFILGATIFAYRLLIAGAATISLLHITIFSIGVPIVNRNILYYFFFRQTSRAVHIVCGFEL